MAVQNGSLQSWQHLKPYVDRWGPTTPFGTLLMVIGFLIVGTIVKGFCLVMGVVLVARIAAGTTADLRRIFFRRMLQMDQRTIDRIGTTNLMTMLSHNVSLVEDGLSNLYGHSIIEPLKMFSCLFVAAMISWQLLLVSLLVTPLGVLLIHRLGRRMRTFSGREIEGYAAVFQTLLETITGIKLVKIFTRERAERNRFKADAQSLYKMGIRIALFDALLRPRHRDDLDHYPFDGHALRRLAGPRPGNAPLRHPHVLAATERSPGLHLLRHAQRRGRPGRKLTDIYNVMVRAIMASEMLYKPSKLRRRSLRRPIPSRRHATRRTFASRTSPSATTTNTPVIRGFDLEIPLRTDHRAGGRQRLRKIDDHQPDRPLLRS